LPLNIVLFVMNLFKRGAVYVTDKMKNQYIPIIISENLAKILSFAKGEISKEEYEEMRKIIES
jgi:uncharacterized membrane protein